MAKAKHYNHTWQTGLDGRYKYCTVCHAVEKQDASTNPIPSQAATLVTLAGDIARPDPSARTKHVTGVWQDFPTDRPTPPAAPTPPATRPEPEPATAPTPKTNKRKELRAWLEDWAKSHEYPALTLRGNYDDISGTVAAGPENWTAWLKVATLGELKQGQKAASIPVTVEDFRTWLWEWGEHYGYPALTIPMGDNIEHRVNAGGDGWAIWLALSDQEVLTHGRMLALCQFPAEPPQVERDNVAQPE